MDRAADVVAGQPRQVQRLRDDTLAGEGGVAVNEDRQRARMLQPWCTGLRGVGGCGARHPDDHRIDELEMTRVGRHGDDELASLVHGHAGAGVVLHVARPAEILAERLVAIGVFELAQNLRVPFLQDVRKDVEAPAVRHPDEHVLHARAGGVGDDLVEDRDEHVHAFDREPRLAGKRAVEEALERLDFA